MLKVNPHFTQIRYIGIADKGLELVRVNQKSNKIEFVSQEDLQAKGESNYFKNTINKAPGESFVSDITLNREHGVIEEPHHPVSRVGTPVYSKGGKVFGAIVINIDFLSFFNSLTKSEQSNESWYVVNSSGDFFFTQILAKHLDLNSESLLKLMIVFPEFKLSEFSGAKSNKTYIHEGSDQSRSVVNFRVVSLEKDEKNEARFIGLVHESSAENIDKNLSQLQNKVIQLIALLLLLALIIGLIFSKSLTQPLQLLASSMNSYAAEGKLGELPTDTKDEVGEITTAFKEMIEKIEEAQVKQNELQEQFRTIITLAPGGLLLVNKDRRIQLINKRIIEYFGYSEEELIGNVIEVLIPMEHREKHPEQVNSFFKNPSVRAMGAGRDLMGQHKDGSLFPVEVGLSPIKIGEELHVLASVVDITKRKGIEEDLSVLIRNLKSSLTCFT